MATTSLHSAQLDGTQICPHTAQHIDKGLVLTAEGWSSHILSETALTLSDGVPISVLSNVCHIPAATEDKNLWMSGHPAVFVLLSQKSIFFNQVEDPWSLHVGPWLC